MSGSVAKIPNHSENRQGVGRFNRRINKVKSMNKKFIWVLILILIIIAGVVYYFWKKTTISPTINQSISSECINIWKEKNNYCQQFSRNVCETKSFSLEVNQQINCRWNDIKSMCEAKAFCI
jgi:hypothetical protein